MFDTMRRLAGIIDVTQSNTHITVSGINGYLLSKDIMNVWGTSRIVTYMFSMFSRSAFRFPCFFAVDVLYIVEYLAQDKDSKYSHRHYHKIAELLRKNTWLNHIERSYKPRIDLNRLHGVFKDGVVPDTYQYEFLKQYDQKTRQYDLNGYLLAAEPGSGKTLMSMFLSYALGVDHSIEIVPMNTVHVVWEDTLNKFFRVTPSYWHSKMGTEPPLNCKHYIFHYDALDQLQPFLRKLRSNNIFIGIDECHNFNDPNSLRTKLLVESVQSAHCRDILPMSGTPIKAMGSESIPLFRMIDKYFNQDAEFRFKKIFGKDAKRANDIICNRIGEVSFKVTQKFTSHEVITEPPIMVKLPNPRPFLLTTIKDEMRDFIKERKEFYKKHMGEFESIYDMSMKLHLEYAKEHGDLSALKEYMDIIRKIRISYDPFNDKAIVKFANYYELKHIIPNLPKEFKKEFKNARSVVKYVDLKIMGEALGAVLGNKRVECHLAMIPYMRLEDVIRNARKKVLIFTSYVEVVDETVRYLTNQGFKCLYVHGENSSELDKIVNEFANDDSYDALVATLKSLSTGVPMVMASDLYFTNAPFRDYERKQAIARVDRRGQDGTVKIWESLLDTGSEPNISTRSKDILAWSQEQVEQIMGIHVPSEELDVTMESINKVIGV